MMVVMVMIMMMMVVVVVVVIMMITTMSMTLIMVMVVMIRVVVVVVIVVVVATAVVVAAVLVVAAAVVVVVVAVVAVVGGVNNCPCVYESQVEAHLFSSIRTRITHFVTSYRSAETGLTSGNMDQFRTKVILHHDGSNTWYAPTILRSRCSINIKYFPFDDQQCELKFGSWTYDGLRVDLINSSATADLSSYMPSGEFEMIEAPASRVIFKYRYHIVAFSSCPLSPLLLLLHPDVCLSVIICISVYLSVYGVYVVTVFPLLAVCPSARRQF